eukprot:2637575-Prymnesium_polylepis.1
MENRAPQVGGRECPKEGLYPNPKRVKISRAVDTALPRKTTQKRKKGGSSALSTTRLFYFTDVIM